MASFKSPPDLNISRVIDILHITYKKVNTFFTGDQMNLKGNKINRVSMRNNAYEIIKNAIISGDLKPGMKIKDKELSEQLGISRTPIREAMLRLEDEELIISKPNSFTMVAPINITEVKEIYSIVIALESLAIQEALIHSNHSQLKQLEDINNLYKKAVEESNAKKCLTYDIEFHAHIVKMSKNKELEKLLIKLKDKIIRVESFYFHKAIPKQKSIHEHDMIINGLRNKKYKEAVDMLRNNWMNSLNNILSKDQ